ncbi:hypothetical protein J2X48_002479 [Bosea sp. BE271]|uniref:hypothetical protein n=1 Tax=Bosea TaxID=85413 RepID=UPI002862644C|nr:MULTISPECIES: hypothetical protein [Bosea]MDR6830793.1 hypothetical protein [Bosea robiniae]MDR6895450.1 hypothetical protein [Bosea sp. BE109]MDR7138846.1 hypothetical protein [Bosea sp. BE168]MDR7175547.1 hypothetical protein [Bosea sp. BE271]
MRNADSAGGTGVPPALLEHQSYISVERTAENMVAGRPKASDCSAGDELGALSHPATARKLNDIEHLPPGLVAYSDRGQVFLLLAHIPAIHQHCEIGA